MIAKCRAFLCAYVIHGGTDVKNRDTPDVKPTNYSEMKRLISMCLMAFAVTVTICAVGAPNAACMDYDSRGISAVDNQPVEVWFYSYDYRTGEFTCQGNGYVRTENGRMVIYVPSQGDCQVMTSDLGEFRYMFSYTDFRGERMNMYFNL